jgi:hypothetical protein
MPDDFGNPFRKHDKLYLFEHPTPRRFPMIAVAKIASCGFMLSLGLFDSVQAAERIKSDPCGERTGGQPPVKCDRGAHQGVHTIKGEVLHINGANLLVKKSDGEEVIFHIDPATQLSGPLSLGDRIEANVNEVEGEKHAVSIRQTE